jgi:hypothetical protein
MQPCRCCGSLRRPTTRRPYSGQCLCLLEGFACLPEIERGLLRKPSLCRTASVSTSSASPSLNVKVSRQFPLTLTLQCSERPYHRCIVACGATHSNVELRSAHFGLQRPASGLKPILLPIWDPDRMPPRVRRDRRGNRVMKIQPIRTDADMDQLGIPFEARVGRD